MAATARSKIIDAIISKLKEIDGTGSYRSNLFQNVSKKLKFMDDIEDFPYVSVVPGNETREYLPSDFKWGFLTVNIRAFIYNEDDSLEEMEKVLSDIETVLDNNYLLEYDTGKKVQNLTIVSITTDEGLMAPYGVGEITVLVQYDLPSVYFN